MKKESLAKNIKKLKSKLEEKVKSSEKPSADLEVRKVKKQLKRSQRKNALAIKMEKRIADNFKKRDKKAA